jgi:hypothetical protein
MNLFYTLDGKSFESLEEAQHNVETLCSEYDKYHIFFVQEVKRLPDDAWQHHECFPTPDDYRVKFLAAADDAWFCVHNPLTGENIYISGKQSVTSMLEDWFPLYLTNIGTTRILQHTGEINHEGVSAFWPYIEVQP